MTDTAFTEKILVVFCSWSICYNCHNSITCSKQSWPQVIRCSDLLYSMCSKKCNLSHHVFCCLPSLSASSTVSGSFWLSVSGIKSISSPDETDIPPNRKKGSALQISACKYIHIHCMYFQVFTAVTCNLHSSPVENIGSLFYLATLSSNNLLAS